MRKIEITFEEESIIVLALKALIDDNKSAIKLFDGRFENTSKRLTRDIEKMEEILKKLDSIAKAVATP